MLRCTVPGKCKLTVPQNSNYLTRSLILETQKFRVSRFESRAWSFESRNKEFFAQLIFHATLRRMAMAVSSGALNSLQGFHADEVTSVALLFFITFVVIFKMISL